MLEPWRSQYLQVLGVEVYRARYPLPVAAPSVEPEWDSAAPVPVPDEELLITRDGIALTPSTSRTERLALPPLEFEAVRNAPLTKIAAPPSTGSSLRIKLSLIAADGGVLIIDDALPNVRNDTQRLLGNLLFALQGRVVNLKVEPFEWPLPNLRNRQIDLNEQAARETLAGLLNRKVQGDVQTILLLGENAQRWVDVSLREILAADRPLSWGLSVSTAAVLNDPKLKRQWWQDLRPAVKR